MSTLGWSKNRMAECHPEQKHYGKGLCKTCYEALARTEKQELRAGRKRPKFCELCGKPSRIRLHYDHDHRTDKFRGWLCHRCNLAIGLLNDDPTLLSKLIDYLLKNREDHAVQEQSPTGIPARTS